MIKLSELKSLRLDAADKKPCPSGGSGYADMGDSRAAAPWEPPSGEGDIFERDLESSSSASELQELGRRAKLQAQQMCSEFIASYDVRNVTVFRGDGRQPFDVFHSGFIRHENITPSATIVKNQAGVEGVGYEGVVSTSTSAWIARSYAHFNANGYVYAVQLDAGKKLDTTVGRDLLGEVAAAYISPAEILFAVGPVINPFRPLVGDSRFEGPQLLINPHAKASDEVAQAAFNEVNALGLLDHIDFATLDPRYSSETLKTSLAEAAAPAALEAQVALSLQERMPFVQRYQQRKDVLLDPSEAGGSRPS